MRRKDDRVVGDWERGFFVGVISGAVIMTMLIFVISLT
jgi:hypothetical protein